MDICDKNSAQRKRLDFAEMELRASRDGLPTIRGYAAVFYSQSDEIDDRYREVVLPGAFSKSLASRYDVCATIDHDYQRPIGRISLGTLQLTEDAKGLLFIVRPPATDDTRDLVARMRRREVRGASFSFLPQQNRWTIRDGKPLCQLIRVHLLEVSIVTSPYYPAAESWLKR